LKRSCDLHQEIFTKEEITSLVCDEDNDYDTRTDKCLGIEEQMNFVFLFYLAVCF
jgi:hypothetical protein